MRELPLAKAFQLIEPGPVVLLTTAHKGKFNVMTLTWHTLMDFTPIIGCVVSNANHSFAALRSTKQCVISIPTVELARKVVDIGNCSGSEVDKFETVGLTPTSAQKVGAPLIAECLAHIECVVADSKLVDQYNFFILEGVKAWIEPKHKERRTIHAKGDGTFVVDGRTINLKNRMVKWLEMT